MSITIVNRQCNFSNISATKERPKWFNRERCFNSILRETFAVPHVNLVVFFDGQPSDDHFINKYQVELVTKDCGSGSQSYKESLKYALYETNSDYFYFVEDDYLHKPGWLDILKEGFDEGFDYFTMYDHADKYSELYKGLNSQIRTTDSCHWRSTPSTTDTFACTREILKEDHGVHEYYSSFLNYSLDHKRFTELGKRGRTIMSCMPGWSTHVETDLMSPSINWSLV